LSLGFAHFAALLSREMDEPALFIGSMAMILLFLVRPMMASFRKKFV
jgi:hypothetical protein